MIGFVCVVVGSRVGDGRGVMDDGGYVLVLVFFFINFCLLFIDVLFIGYF